MRIRNLNIFLFCALIFGAFFSVTISAQSFTASVNRKVIPLGEYFQVSFTINANASNFRPPDFKDFDVYQGPNQSTNMSWVNGVVTQSISLTYLLGGKKEGKFTIGAASITVNGKKLESNPVTVEVVKGAAPPPQNQAQAQTNSPNPSLKNEVASTGSGDDIFVRTFVTKQKCYLGEQLVLTQKVYSRYNFKAFQNYKLPSYTGFWAKEEDRNKQIVPETENLDGIMYYVAEFSKTFLFPQRTGVIEIEPVEVDVITSVQSKKKSRNFWDQFFGGGYEDVLHKLKGKSVKVHVNPLPEENKPANFSGAVGSFSFRAELDRSKVKENEAINLKVTVSGRGNINLIDNPKIEFPAEFETYDPKVNENISVGNIVSGSKTYEYLLIPRKRGEYTIKDFNFSYFDHEKKQYVTIPSPELKITVDAGAPGTTTGAQVYTPTNKIEQAENDIRFIKKGDLELKEQDTDFFNSGAHYALLGLCVSLFAGGLLFRKRFLQANSDIVAVRQRKAARLARKKLVIAEKYKNENNKEKFYDEVSIALYKYVSDKLNIPFAELNRETIVARLSERSVRPEVAQKLLSTLDSCEYARYAPGAVSDNLGEIYTNTVTLISDLEQQESKSKNA
jgi:hypothetical protein